MKYWLVAAVRPNAIFSGCEALPPPIGAGQVDVLAARNIDTMVCNVRELQREIAAERLLHRNVPRLSVRIFVVQGNVSVNLTLEQRRISGNDSIGRNHDRNRRREAGLEGSYRHSIAKHGRSEGRCSDWLIAVVGADGIVVSVVVIRERRVADTEPSTDYCVVGNSISETSARREISVSRLHAQIGWIAADTCQDNVVVDRIVVREATRTLRSRGRIELPANDQDRPSASDVTCHLSLAKAKNHHCR